MEAPIELRFSHGGTEARRKDENTKTASDARTRKDATRREKSSLFFAEAASASLRENPIARGWRGSRILALQEIVWVNCDGGADRAPVFSRRHGGTEARRKDENPKTASDARRRKDARSREKSSLLFAEAASVPLCLRERPRDRQPHAAR